MNDCKFKLLWFLGVGLINLIFWWWFCVFIDKVVKFEKVLWKVKGGIKLNYEINIKLKKEIKLFDNWI